MQRAHGKSTARSDVRHLLDCVHIACVTGCRYEGAKRRNTRANTSLDHQLIHLDGSWQYELRCEFRVAARLRRASKDGMDVARACTATCISAAFPHAFSSAL